MKARLRASGITNKDRKRAIRELVTEEHDKQGQGTARRLIKLLCVSMYEQYRFAGKRGGRIVDQINALGDEHKEDPVFWAHVDRLLKQIGYDFPDENYDEVDE
jgi:hypothetical protein